MRFYILLLALIGAAPAAAQTAPTAPTINPDAVRHVALCYQTCYRDLADYSLAAYHDKTGNCRVHATWIVAAKACGSACNEIWSASGKPPSKIRTAFNAEITREETAYIAHYCHTDNEHLMSKGLIIRD